MEHLFLKCERLKGIFNLLKNCFRKFDEKFSDKDWWSKIYIFKKEENVFIKLPDWNC